MVRHGPLRIDHGDKLPRAIVSSVHEGSGDELEASTPTLAVTAAGNRASRAVRGDEPPPERIEHFRLLGQIGSGGMGAVYEAIDESLDRKVAIKLLHPDAGDQTRLLREAQALARLSHPNVVQIYQVGEHGQQVFVAMELVPGQTMSQWCAARERDWREIVSMYIEAGRGLAAAHAAGLVHRDFKPDNVLVGSDGRPRVVDFGLARSQSDPAPQPAERSERPEPAASGQLLSSPLTRTGAVRGTPAYMAPEQHRGEEASAASDQFAYCVSLYQALFGRRPYDGDNIAALAMNLEFGTVRAPPRTTDVPDWLTAALVKGLSKSPEDRFGSIEDLTQELGAFRDQDLRVSSRARSFVLAASVVLLVLVFAAVIVARRGFGRTPSHPEAQTLFIAFSALVAGSMFVVRKHITKSDLNRRIAGCFLAYLVAGPLLYGAGWRVGLAIDAIFVMELLMSTIAMAVFAFAFDRRSLRPLSFMFACALVAIGIPSWGLEIHASAHVVYFSWFAAIWSRDGLPA
jgi:serine/threonine-protein kinase